MFILLKEPMPTAMPTQTAMQLEYLRMDLSPIICAITRWIPNQDLVPSATWAPDTAGSGINLKGGSNGNLIANNVFYNLKGVGILTYGWDYVAGGTDNIIDGNVVYNSGDMLRE